MTIVDGHTSGPQLIRFPYQSKATGEARQFLMYLPVDYDTQQAYRWPIIFFLHGGGERGDGQADLDYVLLHGPLGEAWIRHRNLPFVMIGPQLPILGMDWQLQLRAGVPKPVRLATPPALRPVTERPTHPIVRAPDLSPAVFGISESWGDDGFPGGWHLCQDDLIMMLDTVLERYRTDPDRVYLTGLSLGGNETLVEIAQRHKKSVAQVVLRWNIQRGVVAIPKSVHKERILENFDVFDFELSDRDMDKITSLDEQKAVLGSHTDPELVKRLNSIKLHD